MLRKKLLASAATVAAAGALVAPAPAQAHDDHSGGPRVRVLSSELAGPFNIQRSRDGVLIADGFRNQVLRFKGGTLTPVVDKVPGTSGIATSRGGRLWAYTSTTTIEGTFTNTASSLTITNGKGWSVTADTLAFEKSHNPDHRNHYGFAHPTTCQRQTLEKVGFPVSYPGAIDSHAYSVASSGRKWYVADAGGNDILSVDNHGHIRTVAVLPPQPLEITQAFADAQGLDSCVVGATYAFEPVPTDVEVGRDGYLYVTTLPGGAEDATLGANGAVWKVNPRNGHLWRVATGFLGATNLALGRHGQIYVTELFGGRISTVSHHHAKPYVDLPGALAVETGWKGYLLASTLAAQDGSSPGTLVRIAPPHRHHH